MSRYIDADALDDYFRDSIVKCKQWFEEASVLREEESTARAEQAYVTFMECSMRLKKQPTVDAVPVEWIKEKIERLKSQDNVFASLTAGMIDAMLTDYCADGERRTDDLDRQD